MEAIELIAAARDVHHSRLRDDGGEHVPVVVVRVLAQEIDPPGRLRSRLRCKAKYLREIRHAGKSVMAGLKIRRARLAARALSLRVRHRWPTWRRGFRCPPGI